MRLLAAAPLPPSFGEKGSGATCPCRVSGTAHVKPDSGFASRKGAALAVWLAIAAGRYGRSRGRVAVRPLSRSDWDHPVRRRILVGPLGSGIARWYHRGVEIGAEHARRWHSWSRLRRVSELRVRHGCLPEAFAVAC